MDVFFVGLVMAGLFFLDCYLMVFLLLYYIFY